jgi:hypothetical protein
LARQKQHVLKQWSSKVVCLVLCPCYWHGETSLSSQLECVFFRNKKEKQLECVVLGWGNAVYAVIILWRSWWMSNLSCHLKKASISTIIQVTYNIIISGEMAIAY